jgi:hypothetical protein
MAGKILEARLVISGQDQTGAAFKEIEKKMATLGKGFAGAANAAQSIARNMSVLGGTGWETMNRNMSVLGGNWRNIAFEVSKVDRQVGVLGRSIKSLGGIAKTTGAMIGAGLSFKAFEGLKGGIGEGAKTVSAEAQNQYAQGGTAAEMAAVRAATPGLLRKYPNVPLHRFGEIFGELKATLQNPNEAMPNLDAAVQLESATLAMGKPLSPEQSTALYKSAELANRTGNQEAFRNYIGAALRAKQYEKGQLEFSDIRDFNRNAGSAAANLSDRFLAGPGMALITEFTGAKAGAAISQMNKTFAGPGLANDHTRIKEWMRLGLIGADDVDYTKTGEAKGLKPGRHVTGWRQGMTDPDAFIKEVLPPKFAALGITDPVEQSAEMTRLFGGKIAPSMADRFRSQPELLDTRSESYRMVGGPGAGQNLTAHDPTAALAEAETALTNMIAARSLAVAGRPEWD